MSDVRHQEPRGMKSPITIREVSTAEELKQAQEIRVRVLEEEQGFPNEINIDGADRSASHVRSPPRRPPRRWNSLETHTKRSEPTEILESPSAL